jgi:SAM-dependent methyltransferase
MTAPAPDIDWTPQTWLDRELQRQRIVQVRPWVPEGGAVLDIGCGDGALFRALGARIATGHGLDPRLRQPFRAAHVMLVPGLFPDDVPQGVTYDAITMTAVLEHFPEAVQRELAGHAARLLRPGGRVIITVPSAAVDRILAVLVRLGLAGGQAEDEHWGFDAGSTGTLFPPPAFRLLKRRSFQFGLNNLFVFERA